MILDELNANKVKQISLINSDRISEDFFAVLVEVIRDTESLASGLQQLRVDATTAAKAAFEQFFSSATEGLAVPDLNQAMIGGYEVLSTGESVELERFDFIESNLSQCEQIIFEKVFFVPSVTLEELEKGTVHPAGSANVDFDAISPLQSATFIEICDIKKYAKKAKFIETYLKTFSYFLQRPKKQHIVKGINFRKYAARRKLSRIVRDIKSLVNSSEVYPIDPARVGRTPERKKLDSSDTIKVSFTKDFKNISEIELINKKSGESIKVFAQSEGDVKNRTFASFNDTKTNYYLSDLDGIFNQTLANALIGKTSFIEIAKLFLAPGMWIDDSPCAAEGLASTGGFFRDADSLVRSALDPEKDLKELAAIYNSGPIKTLELVEKESKELKGGPYRKAMRRVLRKEAIQQGQNISREFKHFAKDLAQSAQGAEEQLDQLIQRASKLDWDQLFAIALASSMSQLGVDGVINEDYIRQITIQFIAQKFNDNQTLKKVLLAVPLEDLQRLADEFGFIKKDKPPKKVKPTPMTKTGLSNDADAMATSENSERRQRLTLEEREERRNTRQDQELSDLRGHAAQNAFLLDEAFFAGNVPLTSAIDPSTGREIQSLTKSQLRRLIRTQTRQLEENNAARTAVLADAAAAAEEYAAQKERANQQFIRREEDKAWYAKNGDQYALSKRYFDKAISTATSDETRTALVDLIVYSLNCDTEESGDQFAKVLEFIIFDLGVDNTILGDVLDYFNGWSKWINAWDMKNLDFCALPDFALPGGFPRFTKPDLNIFPVRIDIGRIPLMDILRYILEAIIKAIFTAILFLMRKIINFLLSLIPDVVFDFDICKLGNSLESFKDALRNAICRGINGQSGSPPLSPESISCYNIFNPAGSLVAGLGVAGADATAGFAGAVHANSPQSVVNFMEAACSGYLPSGDFLDMMNGNISPKTQQRAEAYFAATNPDVLDQISDNPEALSEIGAAIGDIIGIGDIELALENFIPLVGTGIEDICEDPDIEEFFNRYCVSNDPVLLAELEELLKNMHKRQLEDAKQLAGLLANPASIASEINAAIPNLLHPSTTIPSIIRKGGKELPLVKDVPKFAAGRDQETLGDINSNFIISNLEILSIVNSTLSTELAQNARNFSAELQNREIMAERSYNNAINYDLINPPRPPVRPPSPAALAARHSDLLTVLIPERGNTSAIFLTDVNFSTIASYIGLEDLAVDKIRKVYLDDPDFVDEYYSPLEIGSSGKYSGLIFINSQIATNLNDSFIPLMRETNDYIKLLNTTIKQLNQQFGATRELNKFINTVKSNNYRLFPPPDGSESTFSGPGTFVEMSELLNRTKTRESLDSGIQIQPLGRASKIEDNYLRGSLKQENTFRRFIEGKEEYSKILLSYTDAELAVFEETIITFIQSILLQDLPALLVIANSSVRDSTIESSSTPYLVNDLIYKFYGSNLLVDIKKKIDSFIPEMFAVPRPGEAGTIEMASSSMISLILYEINRSRSAKFRQQYGRAFLPSDALQETVDRSVENVVNTLFSGLPDASRAAVTKLSQRFSDSPVVGARSIVGLMTAFKAPSFASGKLSEAESYNLITNREDNEVFLTSTTMIQLSLTADSALSSHVESIKRSLRTNILINEQLNEFDNKQLDLLENLLNGSGTMNLNMWDVFAEVYSARDDRLGGSDDVGIIALLRDIVRGLDDPEETIGPTALPMDFLLHNFNLKLIYRVFSTSKMKKLASYNYSGPTDSFLITSTQVDENLFTDSKHLVALASRANLVEATHVIIPGFIDVVTTSPSGVVFEFEGLSMVELLSYTSDSLSAEDINLYGLSDLGTDLNFINSFLSLESPSSNIKNELSKNLNFLTFFQLAFPFSDIIYGFTNYLIDSLNNEEIMSPATIQMNLISSIVKGKLDGLNLR